MVILDGNIVKESEINSKFHKFIGTFRDPDPRIAYEMLPQEDRILGMYPDQLRGYWREGRFDVPQYVTMKEC